MDRRSCSVSIVSPMNSSRTGSAVTGWKDVGDSAADREFARLVGGIFAREARVHQTLRQVDR